MINLNLETKGKEQEIIKHYLEENASESLAHKINNGTQIVKDTKLVINKKDLDGFMRYASVEAKKLAEKGTNCACVEDKTVFGWAIHYFEESTIEGTLYNPDGTLYKPEIKKTEYKPEVKIEPPKPKNSQSSMFDFLTNNESDNSEIKKESNEETIQIEEDVEPDPLFDDDKPIKSKTPKIVIENNNYINTQTGEILGQTENKQNNDKELVNKLNSLLDGKLEVKL